LKNLEYLFSKITIILGLYCININGRNIRVVVMNNLLPRRVKMHQKFDLKGSSFKRKASKKELEKGNPTFKDLDFLNMMPEGKILFEKIFLNLNTGPDVLNSRERNT
jgi:hypothetical protein